MQEDRYKTGTGEDKAWGELAAADPDRISTNSSAHYDRETGHYAIRIFGEDYAVDPRARKVANVSNPDRPAEYLLNLATPAYMLSARPIPPSGVLVKEFTGAEFFFRGSHTLPLDAIANRFGSDRAGFERACREELGGAPVGLGDCGFGFEVYPRVSMTIVLWLENEEFPARASILFDSNACLHMALDVLWAVALVACQRLLRHRP